MDQVGELAAGVPHQRGHHAHPLTQRLAARDVAEQEPQVGHPGPVDEVGVAADRDVVAEPARVLLRVRVTADPHEQRRVVDRGLLLPAEAEPVRQPARDDRRPEHVLGRLAQAEVDRHRQSGEHLDPAGQRRGCGHRPILVPAALASRSRCSTGGREAGVPDEEDAALREPEVAQVGLRVERRRRAEVLAAVRRGAADDAPDLQAAPP